jgi:hypothetical protein
MKSTHTTIHALGIAGLIPFVAPGILMIAGSDLAAIAYEVAQAYAFAIICFLCGAWWGYSLNTDRRYPIILSNIYLLLAFFVYALAPDWWPVAAPLLLVGIFVTELSRTMFPGLPAFYRYLRAILTLVSASAMFLALLLRPA